MSIEYRQLEIFDNVDCLLHELPNRIRTGPSRILGIIDKIIQELTKVKRRRVRLLDAMIDFREVCGFPNQVVKHHAYSGNFVASIMTYHATITNDIVFDGAA